jgi:hypothetical protein
MSLEQLLALLNAIMKKLAAINERQVGQSQPHQQPQESSYFDFCHTPKFQILECDPNSLNVKTFYQ